MNKKSFVIVILVIIFLVFIFVPFKEILIHVGIINFYKGDNWKIVNKTTNPIKDKIMSLEANIENRYNNYFPFYDKINSLYYNSVINIDSLYLSDIYLKNNNDSDLLFYDKEDKFYYLINHYSNEELNNRLNKQVNFYNDINNKYPNINLAIYIPLRYSETNSKNVFNINDKIYNFANKLNKSIKYNIFDANNYLKYYYKTDHHYNSLGAERVYLDILKMYGLNNDLTINHKIVKNDYYGSMAKSVMLKNVADNLMAIDYSNKLKTNITDENFKPLKIENKTNSFYDYYVKYFNGQYDEIICENNNSYNRNVLIVWMLTGLWHGDSWNFILWGLYYGIILL